MGKKMTEVSQGRTPPRLASVTQSTHAGAAGRLRIRVTAALGADRLAFEQACLGFCGYREESYSNQDRRRCLYQLRLLC